jgi:hypothetical protein
MRRHARAHERVINRKSSENQQRRRGGEDGNDGAPQARKPLAKDR